ncbi:T9SS type A sorting domain-containing protein [candidate division KSB1 bacterium]|nr:T9SS type A sorting domain-containing protein [candidate division KSB1 bacterium]RQW04617.1 MAG: T9SS C-terminal target domain-containing protein [candidate division KSB1 bacterium]
MNRNLIALFSLLLFVCCGALLAQEVGAVLWSDTFEDDDLAAHFEVGWFYYGESDGLVGAVVEQRESQLYLKQGSFTVIGAVLAGTNGVPALEIDENGDPTEKTKEDLLANDFSKPNQEVTFQVNFKNLTTSWFLASTRMIQDDDHIDSDPTESPSYLVYISPLEKNVGLAKVPEVEYAMLDPNGYQWLANMAQYPFELDVNYWVKWYLYESVYKVKVWEGDLSDEPDAWLIEAEDPEPRVTGNYTYFALLNPNPDGTDEIFIDNVTLREVTGGSAVTDRPNLPLTFALEQNYPNPFNPSTEISYCLDKAAEVSLEVYDQTGRLVQQLVQSRQDAGHYRVLWNGRDRAGVMQPSGIYYARLSADGLAKSVKMVLMK